MPCAIPQEAAGQRRLAEERRSSLGVLALAVKQYAAILDSLGYDHSPIVKQYQAHMHGLDVREGGAVKESGGSKEKPLGVKPGGESPPRDFRGSRHTVRISFALLLLCA